MTRPWLTLPPLLVDHARRVRLLRLTTAELRSLHGPAPESERCWRTTTGGRQWQAQIEAAINATSPRLDPSVRFAS